MRARYSPRRAHRVAPLIVGLTGSIAMGKSTAAQMLRALGIAVFDSDAAARALTAPNGGALPAVAKTFPGVVHDNVLDRKALAKMVFSDAQKLQSLEAIIHPLVKHARQNFVRAAARRRCKIVVFDIPLLFETSSEGECDVVLVVSCPVFLQRQRALARPGMTAQLFDSILKRQMPSTMKARRADVVIPSGLGRALTLRRLKKALIF
jgi:dephospho-CoA kinase